MRITLAPMVRDWRRFRGLKQQQLADAAHITRPRLSEIETGSAQPEPETLQRIAAALECSVEDLHAKPTAARRLFKFTNSLCYCDGEYRVRLEGRKLVRQCMTNPTHTDEAEEITWEPPDPDEGERQE